MPNSPDLDLLIQAARTSGEIATGYFNATPEVWEKSGGQGPVTEADLHVNRQLEADLQAARPDYGWLSEETEDGDARQATDRLFVVDPIDGTRSFIQGSEDWAHSLAIVENGIVTVGVVYLPMRDLMYTAQLGQGAQCNGVPLSTTKDKPIEAATVLTAKPNMDPKFWADEAPPFQRVFRSSLAYRLALVAQGQFDAMLTLRPTWEWDVAAGSLLVTEAGGTVSDQAGKLPGFNNAHPQLHGMVAAGGVHHQIIAALA